MYPLNVCIVAVSQMRWTQPQTRGRAPSATWHQRCWMKVSPPTTLTHTSRQTCMHMGWSHGRWHAGVTLEVCIISSAIASILILVIYVKDAAFGHFSLIQCWGYYCTTIKKVLERIQKESSNLEKKKNCLWCFEEFGLMLILCISYNSFIHINPHPGERNVVNS